MKKRILIVAIACMVMSVAAGCSKNTDNQNAKKEETRVVTDAKGKVEIPAEPKRIVDLSGNSDTLDLLGFNVVGTCNSDAYDYTKLPSYLEETLKGAEILGYSMSDTVDVEAVIALNPDLIILSKAQEKSYDQLSEIAPAIMIELAKMDWKEDFMSVAKLMNREEAGKKWMADYEEKAASLGNEVKRLMGEDTTYLSFLASQGSIFIFDGAGLGSFMYEDLGLARPENLPKQENVSLPVVTMEGLAQINADVLIAAGTDEDYQKLDNSGIWRNLLAVKTDRYKKLPASPYFNQGYSPVGRQVLLEEVRSYIDENQ
ncbi:ABC transporter substrate-binding protein [[Clostridium] polysaccharolyticum]|uniref:Iron complex transport system substrate-binding protein n=1 Tax=[Clostridium] polysaccharolyticum TaxID=29364 RepID=A0A1H9Y403_9FIRM|nr:ABC transporter substrate-binding protein [[Clostridium] polysaccharolyticum]SES63557.1 iron complex transport system substrate-binding protein [[Clostridium] polysaccharolyticum]